MRNMRIDKRREKSANYTRNEKHLLLDKALPYLDIIENKKTDTLTVEVKVKSWTLVAQQYNLSNPKGQRRVNQLKNLYENIKKRTKKDILMYQTELKDTGGKTTLRRIDDIGWRLIKTVPSLRALWKSTLQMRQNIVSNQEAPSPAEESESLITPEPPAEPENIDYAVVIKEEYTGDGHEFLTEEEFAEITDAQSEMIDINNSSAQITNSINDIITEDAEINFTKIRRENSIGISDSLYEIDKEIKKRELEKLDLDIQMKKLEVEFMKGRLKEQEMNLKFKELEYEIKRQEYSKQINT